MTHERTKRVALVFLGVLFAILIVEALLRVFGWGYDYLQNRRNSEFQSVADVRLTQSASARRTVTEGAELVIVCIGGSTTAMGGGNSWPMQLQRILNNVQDQWTFRVINKGRVGEDTDYIVKHLPNWLDNEMPDFVFAMVGINDTFLDTFQFRHARALRKFRTFSLVEWIYGGLKNRVTKKKRDLLTANPNIYQLHPRTISNLNDMVDLTARKRAEFVFVQYALTKTDSLKAAIKHSNVVYISNYEIFRELLKQIHYEEFFIDKFGGNFGHATSFGNRVIAENVARQFLNFLDQSGRVRIKN